MAYGQQLASQQPPGGQDVFVQTDPRWLFGGGMVGYEVPYSNGMLSGKLGTDKINLNWNNGNHDVDFWLKKGNASINWTGKFL